jgi:hypothetical protein
MLLTQSPDRHSLVLFPKSHPENNPIFIQLTWGDILSFIWDRFSKYQNQKRDIHQWDDIGKELKGLVDRHIKDEFVKLCLNGMGVRT